MEKGNARDQCSERCSDGNHSDVLSFHGEAKRNCEVCGESALLEADLESFLKTEIKEEEEEPAEYYPSDYGCVDVKEEIPSPTEEFDSSVIRETDEAENRGMPPNESLNNVIASSANSVPAKRRRGPKVKQWLLSMFGSNDRKYHCDKCDYATKIPQALIYHKMTHTGEKPFRCKYCEYEASHPTTLTRHMRRHTGEKPYACELCDYKSAQPQGLYSHIRRAHTGEKPFTCDLCPYTAHDLGTLSCHKLSHLRPEEKPYECSVCGMRMNRRSHLRRHADKRHPGVKISLDKLTSAKRKRSSYFTVDVTSPQLPRKMRPMVKRRPRLSSEFASEAETTDEDDITLDAILEGDTEYRPDTFLPSATSSNLIDRPKRKVVAPKKLDL